MPAVAKAGLEATYDIVLYSEFISKAALGAWQEDRSMSRSSRSSTQCGRRGNASIMKFDSSLQQCSRLKPVLRLIG
jgi:hypothetical protein